MLALRISDRLALSKTKPLLGISGLGRKGFRLWNEDEILTTDQSRISVAAF